mmetsp:Transcript_69851/g.117300  ORF Transcript_69851/g.117300 Transcript_69851/m.117300 type:complete len:91 (+) Transcript_69851:81-353(+)
MGCGCSDENHEEHPPNLNQFKFGTSNQTMMRIEREGEKAAENVPDAKVQSNSVGQDPPEVEPKQVQNQLSAEPKQLLKAQADDAMECSSV